MIARTTNNRARNLARLIGVVVIYVAALVAAVAAAPGVIPELSHAGMAVAGLIATVGGLLIGTGISWTNYRNFRNILIHGLSAVVLWGFFMGDVAAQPEAGNEALYMRSFWLFLIASAGAGLIGLIGGRMLPLQPEYSRFGNERYRIKI